MVKEKISIIVPVFNTAKYLNQFFSQLDKQEYTDFKVYIVYDESQDDSYKIIKNKEKNSPNKYKVLFSPKKNGLGAARDFALDSGLIKGDYVLFLDPDDYPNENFLSELIKSAEETDADITMCGFERFDDETGKVLCTEMINNPIELITDVANFDLLAYMNPVVWDKLYKRKLIENIRFGIIRRSEDVFWLMRMIPYINSIKCVNKSLYHYRVRSDSLLNSITKKDYEEVLSNYVKVSNEYKMQISNSDYVDIINLIAFLRCGIGITYRAALHDLKNATWYCERSKETLNVYYAGWQHNRFLRFNVCKKHGLKGIAIWGCLLLYKSNLFVVYIYLYYLFTKIFKKEVKW